MAQDIDWKQPYELSMALCRYINKYISGGGCDPTKVADYWRQTFSYVAKYLGFNRKARRTLWYDLAADNWERLHPTEDESRYTSDRWLEELMLEVHYYSDIWSFDGLMRCHWTYRRYVWAFCNEVSLA